MTETVSEVVGRGVRALTPAVGHEDDLHPVPQLGLRGRLERMLQSADHGVGRRNQI